MTLNSFDLDIEQILKEYAGKTEGYLEKYLSEYGVGSELSEAMKYAVLGGGKRIRAFLVFKFAEIFGGSEEAAAPFACAAECIHAYSLIHDDLPCMDNDDMRRGKPSCHKRFGETVALLAGDALQSFAFELITSNSFVSDRSVASATKCLAKAASDICLGQYYDAKTKSSSLEELRRMYGYKTGELIKASCLLGLISAAGDPDGRDIANVVKYASSIGLTFQIQDDILDVRGDEAKLGKPIGSDEKNDKETILHFMTEDEAVEFEYQLTADAVSSISEYEGSSVLSQFAVWLITRNM